MRCFFLLLLLFSGLMPPCAAAGPWVLSPHGRSRLAGPYVDEGGIFHAALEIDLNAGWKTYWRSPGPAGLPPSVWRASDGEWKSVEILFPAPERFSVSGFEMAGYQGRVLLPLRIGPSNKLASGPLDFRVSYAVCKDVCIPVLLRMPLPAGRSGGPEADIISDAIRNLPAAVPPPSGFSARLVPSGIALSNVPSGTLYVEGADGLLFAGPAAASGHLLISLPPDRIGRLKEKWIVLTLARAQGRAIFWRARM